MSTENSDSNAAENTTAPTEEVEAPVEAPTETEPEPAAVETPTAEVAKPTKGSECNHPSNTTGYCQKGPDKTCIYCGH